MYVYHFTTPKNPRLGALGRRSYYPDDTTESWPSAENRHLKDSIIPYPNTQQTHKSFLTPYPNKNNTDSRDEGPRLSCASGEVCPKLACHVIYSSQLRTLIQPSARARVLPDHNHAFNLSNLPSQRLPATEHHHHPVRVQHRRPNNHGLPHVLRHLLGARVRGDELRVHDGGGLRPTHLHLRPADSAVRVLPDRHD